MGLFSRRRSSTKRIATKPFRPRFELLEARQMLAAADLSAWAGVGNVTSPNNYSVVSSTSAGGTFDGRRFGTGEAAAYLADAALLTTGGAALPDLNRTTAGGFGATGTLTFDASATTAIVDPVFYYGFFDNENPAQGAFGFSFADQTSTSFRFRATAGTTQGSTVVVAQGTYTYDIDVNNADSGANTVRVRLFDGGGATVANVTVAIPGTLALQADSFGFLQPLASSDSDNTFSMTVSNINYTGETQTTGVPETPTGLTATVVSSSQIDLAWTDVATETSYEIQRATNSSFTSPFTYPSNAANDTTLSATGLTASTTYWFRVRAVNAAGASAYSTAVSATTQPVASSTFYLDLDSGSDTGNGLTAGTAWRTMDKAIRHLPNDSFNVLITAGTYTQVQTTVLAAPIRTGLVTFKPAAAGTVTLQGTSGTPTTATVQVDWKNVTNVRLEGLNFVRASVQIRETENFGFVNNDITDASLLVYGADGAMVEGNNFHGYTTGKAGILFRSYNIYLIPGSQKRDFHNDNITIKNNVLDMNNKTGDGIHVEVGTNILIEKNDIKNVATSTQSHGDSIQLVEINTSTITGNTMSGGRGIILMHFRNGDGSLQAPIIPNVNYDVTFTNNVHSNGGSFSLTVSDALRLKVINNTLWGTSSSEGAGLALAGRVFEATIVNNILKTMTVSAGTTFKARGNNLIDVLYNNSGYPNLFAGEVDVAATFVNSFVNYAARDLHLISGSLGVNQGVNNGGLVQGDTDGDGDIDGNVAVSGVPALDFDGQAITGGIKDIGAFEL